MIHNIHENIRRLFGRIGLRLVRARRGSVLILVVVLLVLMAILGTAFLVTARTDLGGSKLYEHNVQIDLLVQGVINMAEAALTDTTYQTVPTAPGTLQYYDDWSTDSSANGVVGSTIDHSWLSARFPTAVNDPTGRGAAIGILPASGLPLYPVPKGAVVQVGPTSPPSPALLYVSLVDNNTTNVSTTANWASFAYTGFGPVSGNLAAPIWPAVTAPLAVSGNYQAHFEDPRSPAFVVNPSGYVTINGVPQWSNVRTFVSPTSLPLNTGQGPTSPALTYFSPFESPPKIETALAASATGNGIADSFLWRLPVGSIDGITYYAAVRIVDNNSAINVNTANSSVYEWAYNGTPDYTGFANVTSGASGMTPGILPSGIGLDAMTYTFNNTSLNLTTTDSATVFAELMEVNRYRWTSPGAPGTTVTHPAGIQGSGTSPIDDLNNPHTDFTYRNVGDAMWMGLGRRISNPGYVQAGLQYTPFSWGESAELAYRGDLINPNATPSVIEQVLAPSVYNHTPSATPGAGVIPSPGITFRTQPWDPINTSTWFNGYEINVRSTAANARPYFVARNPTNNCMPAHSLTTAVTGLQPADLTNVVQSQMAGTYFTSTQIPRVSLNTADITVQDGPNLGLPSKGPTLWFGFYNAMLDAMTPTAILNLQPASNQAGQAMFRSPLRDIVGVGPTSTTYLTGPQTMLLRSLLAACNAKDLRDTDDDVTVEPPPPNVVPLQQVIQLQAMVSGNANTPVDIYAFGIEKQPFITEVYANTEQQPAKMIGVRTSRANPFYSASNNPSNPKGYVAVQLYNPYDVPINMSGWTLGILVRNPAPAASPYPNMQMTNIPSFNGFGATAIIPAHSYMLLENIPSAGFTSAGTPDATYRPWANYFPGSPVLGAPALANTVLYYVPNLHYVMADANNAATPFAGELVLLRQRLSNGTGGNPANPANLTNLKNNFAPVDSFDFSGLSETAPSGTAFTAIHYLRANPGFYAVGGSPVPPTVQSIATYWKFVYPGRWSLSAYQVPINAENTNAPGPFTARQEGIAVGSWNTNNASNNTDFWTGLASDASDKIYALGINNTVGLSGTPTGRAYLQPVNLSPAALGTPAGTVAGYPYASSYPNAFPAIQLNNTDMGGPTKQYSTNTPFMFPFGGFARVGDVLQAPYIGSYFVLNGTDTAIIECNPITRDSALADDQDYGAANPTAVGADDPIEQLGRFCPLLYAQQSTEAYVPVGTAALPGNDYYGWASHVFDYFTTVQNPNDDYFPNTDPNTYAFGAWNLATHQYQGPANTALPVLNSAGGTPNAGSEDLASIEGLININTASMQTLSAVPFIPVGGTSFGQSAFFQDDQGLAADIVTYRNTYGPFKTLFDLNRVLKNSATANFQNFNASSGLTVDPSKVDYTPAMGDISPLPATGTTPSDGVTNDFETRFAMITRVSNLLTTRSDTYTVYVLVQGWSGVGTATPQVVVQRRAAFIVNRSKLTSSNRSLGVTQVTAY